MKSVSYIDRGSRVSLRLVGTRIEPCNVNIIDRVYFQLYEALYWISPFQYRGLTFLI